MRLLSLVPLLFLIKVGVVFAAGEVPSENQIQGKEPPAGLDTFISKVCSQLVAPPQGKIEDLFFPRDPFIQLKDIPQSGKYFDKLVEEFRADWQRAAKTISDATRGWQCGAVKKGYCKWKAVGSEYNKIPYWSCYRSNITVSDNKGKKETIPLKVIINWGKEWYITHMGK
jgi:hypothetical protein